VGSLSGLTGRGGGKGILVSRQTKQKSDVSGKGKKDEKKKANY